MAGGKALVALHVLPDGQPQVIEHAVLIRVWAGSGDKDLEAEVRDDRADGEAEQHGGSEAPRRFEEHQAQGEKDQADPALSEKGNQFKERGEEAARGGMESVHGGGDALVEGFKGGVDPLGRCGHFHDVSPDDGFS